MKRKNLILILAALCFIFAGCTEKGPDSADPQNPGEEQEDTGKLVEVDGKVRFYVSVDNEALSVKMGLKKHDWSTNDKIRVNNSQCNVRVDDKNRYYIDVNVAADKVYKASYYESNKYFPSSCFTGVIIPHAQYYKNGGKLSEFPMYAVYSEATGNKLAFKDGYATLAITIKGSAAVSAIKVEDLAGECMSGSFNFNETKKALVAASRQDGIGYVSLNCGNDGQGVKLSSGGVTFNVVVPARNYASGLRLTICDRDHLAMFHEITAADIAPNSIHKVSVNYAPEPDLCFYEGFDTFVWGGNFMVGEGSVAYSPTGVKIGVNDGTNFTGYEESLVAVSYDNPGSGFMQSVANKAVSESHQMSESYLKSRNLYDWQRLFRCQEYQGYMAVATATTGYGMLQTPTISTDERLSDVKISFKFCFQPGVADDVFCRLVNGGVFQTFELNGQDVPLNSSNSGSESGGWNVKLLRSQVQIPSSAAQSKNWNTVTLIATNVSSETALQFSSVNLDERAHGVYIDEIKVEKIANSIPVDKKLRVLFWNIQNGMWAGQGDNYNQFVDWVKSFDPDICLWCETKSIYKTGTNTGATAAEKYLPGGWADLAARYGHQYWAMGGDRDNYPQVITTKSLPITKIQAFTSGPAGVVITHGAGHFRVNVNGRSIDIVTLHLWPQSYAYGVTAAEQAQSSAEKGGDKYREKEIIDILAKTIKSSTYSGVTNWLMAGDFNSLSPVDNWHYKYSDSDTRFLVHQYIRANTQMKDAIGDRYPNQFHSSTAGNSRIDFIYASPAMFDMMNNSLSVVDSYTIPVRHDASGFYIPSDHRPVMAEFYVE